MKDNIKIVKIINTHQVVINAGSNQNVLSSDVFEIYETGEPVIDPDTKRNLGTLDYIKGYLDVKNIYPNMTVCVNHDYTSPTNALAGMANALSNVSRPKELNVKIEDISGGFENVQRKIQVGDKVRKSSI